MKDVFLLLPRLFPALSGEPAVNSDISTEQGGGKVLIK
jgi:hypothetical protein